MEATSDYWRPPFYLFEAHGLAPWLVNAKDVRHLPGRPKTDVLDSVWLCKVAERQMLRASFVPPHEIRRLRDLTRYRVDLVGARNAEKNRVEKLLEDALLTELLDRFVALGRRAAAFVATVPSCDWSSGCAAGSVDVGRRPLRVTGVDGRGVRAVPAC